MIVAFEFLAFATTMALCSSPTGVAPLVRGKGRLCAPKPKFQTHVSCSSPQAEPQRDVNRARSEGLAMERRGFCSMCGALALAPVNGIFSGAANAVQGFTAGRIPGLCADRGSACW